MYDALVIGARCAGAPTAMLLARKGYRVLLVDKARFPSDHLSTHYLRLPGLALLKRWGLLERVTALDCPPLTHVRFDFGPCILSGAPLPFDDIDAAYCPRRTVFDKLLVDAAVEAGVELREGFLVQELCVEDGRVTGAYGSLRGGTREKLQARLVIGADGLHSLVARSMQASTYNTHPIFGCAYYAYWSGVPHMGAEVYLRDQRAIVLFPTNDGCVVLYVAWPYQEFARYRADIENNYLQTIDLVPELSDRIHSGKREGRFQGTADLPNFFRRPYGSGWALVGDAGYHKDPALAFGMTDAFRDAELLTEALDAGWSGKLSLDEALADYERRRNEVAFPLYDLTCQMASFEPRPPELEQLLQALSRNAAETARFFSVMEGTVPIHEFFDPVNIGRIMSQSS
jgi:2-polyprenyl-6-methoxyphenol hydroxylase-like FAD-dependent oxidoreductase